MPTEAFVDLLLGSFPGQILACNILDGLQTGIINRTFVSEVLRWWEHLVVHGGYRTPQQLVDALNVVRDNDYPAGMPNYGASPDFRFKGSSGLSALERQGVICCAVPAGLLPNVIEKSDRDRLIASGVTFPASRSSPWVLNAVDALMNLRESERLVHLDPTKRVGSSKSVLWFTRRTSLLNMLRGCSRAREPDRARDGLGLIHRKRNEVLILLLFPAAILTALTSARPTFVDAGNHSRFKSIGGSPRAKACPNWGWTTHLEKFYSAQRTIDGCRERVCASIAAFILANGGEFSFQPLGMIMVPRNDTEGILDEQFAHRLQGGRTVQDLKNAMLAIP